MRSELALLLIAAACGASSPKPPLATSTTSEGAAIPDADAFRVEHDPVVACARATPCEARLVLHALEPFKVNTDYPTKFVADPAPGIAIDGTGTFAPAETTGVLTLRMQCSEPGETILTGKFKFSVCTDDVCKIEDSNVKLLVRVGS
jgi:hypothetical protein